MSLSTLLSCSVGGATLAFQLTSYKFKVDPRTKAGLGRVGSKVSVEGEGYITGTSASDLAGKVLALQNSLYTSGKDFRITGANGAIEVDLPAASCLDQGPHLAMEVVPDGGLKRTVRFAVAADTGLVTDFPDLPKGRDAPLLYTEKATQRPDMLWTIERSGELNGPNLMVVFQTWVWPSFDRAYPASDYTRQIQLDRTVPENKLSFTMTAVELLDSLPVSLDKSSVSVDGTGSVSVSRDEQSRLIKSWDFDLLVMGDAMAVLAAIRPDKDPLGPPILREKFSISMYHEQRLKATFETLTGADGTELLDYAESFRFTATKEIYEEKTYPGLAPVLVLATKYRGRCVQSGSATGAGKFPRVPTPLVQPVLLAKAPEITWSDANFAEKQVSWSYEMYLPEDVDPDTDGTISPTLLSRPQAPTFYGEKA